MPKPHQVHVANAFFNNKEEGSCWYDIVSEGKTRDGTEVFTFETDEDSTSPGVYVVAVASTFFLGLRQ